MKLLIASDIHGSAATCQQLIDDIRVLSPDRVLLLGDLLYHGPRNDLPDRYAPKSVIPLLNGIRDLLLCVRGNCDTEVDQMVLDFPILADYALLFWEGRRIYATHGHKLGPDNPPPLCRGDLLLCGHTHVPAVQELDCGALYLNPGSVTIPKQASARGYLLLEGDILSHRELGGREIRRVDLRTLGY